MVVFLGWGRRHDGGVLIGEIVSGFLCKNRGGGQGQIKVANKEGRPRSLFLANHHYSAAKAVGD